jgi:two-component system, chemotaxis family, sensor kinase CheA
MANILIVDDRSDDQITLKSVLEAKKHKVTVADDGKSAKVILENNEKFDLIILDVILPDISGEKLLEYIRDKFGNEVKCIYTTIILEQEVDKEKIDGFVQKPYTTDKIYSEVARCLNL